MNGAIPSDGGPLVYVDDLDRPRLDGDDHHHLARVRRVRDGDPIIVGDGRGHWRPARMHGDSPQPTGEPTEAIRPEPELTIAFGLSKGHKPDWTVQKLTEIGIDRIVVFTAGRSIVRWDDDRRDAARIRFERIAREAARQSRRAHLPTIDPITDFAGAAAHPGACRADRQGGAPDLARPVVLIGPEGGWDPAEVASNLPVIGLGPGVLRAETAAIVAGGVLAALRSGLVTTAEPRRSETRHR